MKTIKIIFWAVLALMLAAVILFETNEQLTGFLGVTEADEFKLLSVMEMLTLMSIFLMLRLFKFERIARQIEESPQRALPLWTSVRVAVMLVMIAANGLLYYGTMNTTFGYLAIIMMVSLPFVYPQKPEEKNA
ncbi:MAG: hypothetical protein SPF39_07920 [Prevotella sp.]|nr:hypothetical protein [Prevotella sp.]